MPIKVRTPHGILSFPDGTTPDDMADAISKLDAAGNAPETDTGGVTPDESPSTAGFLANVADSGINTAVGMGKGIGQVLSDPAQAILDLPAGIVGRLKMYANDMHPMDAVDKLRKGDVKGAIGTALPISMLYHDPVGVAADVAGGVGIADAVKSIGRLPGRMKAAGAARTAAKVEKAGQSQVDRYLPNKSGIADGAATRQVDRIPYADPTRQSSTGFGGGPRVTGKAPTVDEALQVALEEAMQGDMPTKTTIPPGLEVTGEGHMRQSGTFKKSEKLGQPGGYTSGRPGISADGYDEIARRKGMAELPDELAQPRDPRGSSMLDEVDEAGNRVADEAGMDMELDGTLPDEMVEEYPPEVVTPEDMAQYNKTGQLPDPTMEKLPPPKGAREAVERAAAEHMKLSEVDELDKMVRHPADEMWKIEPHESGGFKATVMEDGEPVATGFGATEEEARQSAMELIEDNRGKWDDSLVDEDGESLQGGWDEAPGQPKSAREAVERAAAEHQKLNEVDELDKMVPDNIDHELDAPKPPNGSGVSRRDFLKRGSAGIVGAGFSEDIIDALGSGTEASAALPAAEAAAKAAPAIDTATIIKRLTGLHDSRMWENRMQLDDLIRNAKETGAGPTANFDLFDYGADSEAMNAAGEFGYPSDKAIIKAAYESNDPVIRKMLSHPGNPSTFEEVMARVGDGDPFELVLDPDAYSEGLDTLGHTIEKTMTPEEIAEYQDAYAPDPDTHDGYGPKDSFQRTMRSTEPEMGWHSGAEPGSEEARNAESLHRNQAEMDADYKRRILDEKGMVAPDLLRVLTNALAREAHTQVKKRYPRVIPGVRTIGKGMLDTSLITRLSQDPQ